MALLSWATSPVLSESCGKSRNLQGLCKKSLPQFSRYFFFQILKKCQNKKFIVLLVFVKTLAYFRSMLFSTKLTQNSMYKSRLSQNEYKFNFLHFSSNFLNISNEYNIQSLLEIQSLSDLEISNINGNQRMFPFK